MSELSTPVVTVVDGAVTTLSTDVATFFGKNHRDVVRSIENILSNLPENRVRNFAQTVVTRENPSGGAPIKSKAYRLTRDGFTFLAMGFTGERAQAFKWAYIDAFNKMEAALRQCPAQAQLPPPSLSEQQAYAVMSEVAKRAKNCGAHYQTIYRALKARYQITKYTHIPAASFDDAIAFIRSMELRVPEVPQQEPRKGLWLSDHQAKRLSTFLYELYELFAPSFQAHYDLLVKVKSPDAPRFYESFHSFSAILLAKYLADNGYGNKATA